MTAPDRIQVWADKHPQWGPQWKCCPMPLEPMVAFKITEYVRADLAQNAALRAEAQEMGVGMVTLSHELSMEHARAEAAEAKVEKLRGERDALEKHIEDTAKDTHKLLVAAEAKVEKLRAALQSMPSVVRHTTVCQGPSWPDDRPGVWIAALTACENAVQEAVDAALTTEERHDG